MNQSQRADPGSKHENKRPSASGRRMDLLALIGLGILVSIAFGNTLRGGFVFDDHSLIEENPRLHSIRHLPDAFSMDFYQFHSGKQARSSYYRPLVSISYMIDYALWHLNAKGYHATNVLLHFLVTVLIFLLLKELYGERWLALAAASLWSVHPIASESVAWIAGRTDSLSGVFICAALLLYVKYRESGNRYWLLLAALTTYTACLSKEIAVVIPALAIAAEATPARHRLFTRGSPLRSAGVLLLPVLIFLVQRFYVLGAMTRAGYPEASLLAALRVLSRGVTYYARSLVWPVGLMGDIHVMHLSWSDPYVLVGAAIVAAFVVGLTYASLIRRAWVFALLWFAVTFAPVSGIFMPMPIPVATRYLYLSSLGLILALVLLLRSPSARLIRCWLVGAAVAALVPFTILHNRDYKSDEALYASLIAHAHRHRGLEPGYFSLVNWGRIRAERGAPQEAEELLRLAIEEKPLVSLAWNNLGNVLGMTGRTDEALKAWARSANLDPSDPAPHLNIGTTYERAGQYREAIQAYRTSLDRGLAEPRRSEVQARCKLLEEYEISTGKKGGQQ